MQNATGCGAAAKSGDRDDVYRSVVADLAGLLERIHASLELVEQAIVVEMSAGKEDIGADVVVLDDITPGYVRASTALQACGASLGVALHLLQEPMTAGVGGGAAAGDARAVHPPASRLNLRFLIESAAASNLGSGVSTCTGQWRSRHHGVCARRVAVPLLAVLALDEGDVHFRAVDAHQFAAPIGKAG